MESESSEAPSNARARGAGPHNQGPEKVTADDAANSEASCGGIQNPFEALQLLVQAVSKTSPGTQPDADPSTSPSGQTNAGAPGNGAGLFSYGPIAQGYLDPRLLDHLLQHYAERYHPLMPVVPSHVLTVKNAQQTAIEEPFLLTAILTIATKDRPELDALHNQIWTYMQQLILHVALGSGSTRHVASVEGLLLLAEWAPYGRVGAFSSTMMAENGEDSAWSLLGLAVRQGYLLHLDSFFFRTGAKGEAAAATERNRIAWTFTYLLDRQISIRMGQAFWCRGPGSSARFTADDYPSLQPKHAYEDDYASLLEAQVEITGLFGNVHDILYASKKRTIGLMLMGDYTRYLDDHDRGLAAWKGTWGSLKVSPYLKSLLDLQHEYLRLYVTAFAFQAVVCRTLHQSQRQQGHVTPPRTYFPDGVMACPDSRYIFSAVEAASNLLRILCEQIDPVRHLRYLPVRFLLYGIYSGVFLFKAYSFGAIPDSRHEQSTSTVRAFIDRLNRAAVTENHTAARYSVLLSSLWFPETRPGNDTATPSGRTADQTQRVQEADYREGQGAHPPSNMATSTAQGVPNPVNFSSGLSNPSNAFNPFGSYYNNFTVGQTLEDLAFPGVGVAASNDVDLGSVLQDDSFWFQM